MLSAHWYGVQVVVLIIVLAAMARVANPLKRHGPQRVAGLPKLETKPEQHASIQEVVDNLGTYAAESRVLLVPRPT